MKKKSDLVSFGCRWGGPVLVDLVGGGGSSARRLAEDLGERTTGATPEAILSRRLPAPIGGSGRRRRRIRGGRLGRLRGSTRSGAVQHRGLVDDRQSMAAGAGSVSGSRPASIDMRVSSAPRGRLPPEPPGGATVRAQRASRGRRDGPATTACRAGGLADAGPPVSTEIRAARPPHCRHCSSHPPGSVGLVSGGDSPSWSSGEESGAGTAVAARDLAGVVSSRRRGLHRHHPLPARHTGYVCRRSNCRASVPLVHR